MRGARHAALVYDKGLHATYSTRYLAHKIRYLTANLPFSAKLRIFNSMKRHNARTKRRIIFA